MIKPEDRLTYKSFCGDYGSQKEFADEWEEKCALRNRLGKYEDLGFDATEVKLMAGKLELLTPMGTIDVDKFVNMFGGDET